MTGFGNTLPLEAALGPRRVWSVCCAFHGIFASIDDAIFCLVWLRKEGLLFFLSGEGLHAV